MPDHDHDRDPDRESREEKESLTPADEAFDRALDAALARRSWNELRIDSECRDEGEALRTIRLYGTGVGIWNHERQFAVPQKRLLDLLKEIDRARFSRIPGPSAEEEEGEEEGIEMPCRVQIVLDGTEKQAERREEKEGEEEEAAELEPLAERILAVGESFGRAGVAVASLDEGLEKLARGELAPEVLTLHLLRQPEGGESGWMLRVEGGDARLSRISPETGWTRPQRIHLSAAEVADLARTLAAARPNDLPVNLYSSSYQDLRIEVLGHAKSIQARQFAKMTPETQGEKQERFDRLGKVLEALAARFQPGAP
jgi:hypothetical protein